MLEHFNSIVKVATSLFYEIVANPHLLLDAKYVLHADPLLFAVLLCIVVIIWCYVMSIITGNSSQVYISIHYVTY